MNGGQNDVNRDPPTNAEENYGELHFWRVAAHLRVCGGMDPHVTYDAGVEGWTIMIESSPHSPFDLYFDRVDEFWGAAAHSLVVRFDNVTVWTKCLSSETDATAVAMAIVDAVKDFRDKHQYEKVVGGWHALPTSCEGTRCPHIMSDR